MFNITKEKKLSLFGSYIPQACFAVFAIEPALKAKPWLDYLLTIIASIVLVLSIIATTKSYDSLTEFLTNIHDTKLDWCVWLFISILGILVSFALDDMLIIVWTVFAIGDIICLLIPANKYKQ